MKVRTNRGRNVVLEMERKDAQLPPISLPELQLKRILAAVDFSDCSRKALHYAVSFARQFSAELVILHVVVSVPPPPQMVVAEGEVLASRYRDEAVKQLAEWRKNVPPEIATRTAVRDGTGAAQEIIDAAQEYNTDLIVIGNRGRTGLARLLTGSTTERVVRHAPCPVLVVREREHDFIPEESASAKSPE